MSMKINKLEIENVKRVKAVRIEPTQNGLTVIGGNNNQGKTSVLDAIAWALGGNKFKPSEPKREGSLVPPTLKITMSNGLVVERKGKNSDLKVTDPSGQKSGQGLLDSFVEELALDLPKFMNAPSREKAQTLLQIIGVGDKLGVLEKKEKELYARRTTIGQIADQKHKYAKEMTEYPDAPKELVSASDLIKQQQEILARNGENQRLRTQHAHLKEKLERSNTTIADINKKILALNEQLLAEQNARNELELQIETSQKTVEQLNDESTAEIERSIQDIELINARVRANLDKEKAEEDASEYAAQYSALTTEIENIRKDIKNLLDGANLPLEGLTVQEGELVYLGQRWDNMSGSQQLKVATAIVRKLKPECGFVLLDKLEQMDIPTLNEFGVWLKSEGLQAIATRVGTGEECSIIIEDGYVKGEEHAMLEAEPETPKFTAGEF